MPIPPGMRRNLFNLCANDIDAARTADRLPERPCRHLHVVARLAAGGGKTVGLIWNRCATSPRVANFSAVFSRRTTPQITNPGGFGRKHRFSGLVDRPGDRATDPRAHRCPALLHLAGVAFAS
jgi:hypothetical protein